LQQAANVASVNLNVTWEPFYLNSSMPDEGEDIEAHLYKKYGINGVKMLKDPNAYLYVAGRKAGIEFTNKRNIYPTKKAHALMEYAKNEKSNDVANQMMEEMFHRYFEKGDNINSEDVLAEIAQKVGIDESSAKEAVKNDQYLYEVNEKDKLYKQQMRISGVPFFLIERKDGQRPIGFSGAQPVEIMAEQLEEATEA
jgi:predicted DsbA family dithiol-disulfide isomerase